MQAEENACTERVYADSAMRRKAACGKCYPTANPTGGR
jgi:hypothetical protein